MGTPVSDLAGGTERGGFAGIDLLVFDVDGVLVDASRSYPAVVAESLVWAWIRVLGRIPDGGGFSYDHFAATKTHPAFNDDYDIAWAAINCAAASSSYLLSESLPPPEEWRALLEDADDDLEKWVKDAFGVTICRKTVRDVCGEMYFGGDEYERLGMKPVHTTRRSGFWEREAPLVSFSWKDLPLPAAIYTGRSAAELALGLKVIGWEDFPESMTVSSDDDIFKPSPLGLSILCGRAGASRPLFLGDAESDRQAARTFGNAAFAAIGDFLPHEPLSYKNPAEALAAAGIF
ncbi:MAG: haloacid dehalogenase [Synergistaceae bacterium]|nr:haloacid dehalogenase [Synergistaceae bacterium]